MAPICSYEMSVEYHRITVHPIQEDGTLHGHRSETDFLLCNGQSCWSEMKLKAEDVIVCCVGRAIENLSGR
jgi:hypothetical protein